MSAPKKSKAARGPDGGRFKANVDRERNKRVGREPRVARELRQLESIMEGYRQKAKAKGKTLDEARAMEAVEAWVRIKRKRKLKMLVHISMEGVQEWRRERVMRNAHIRHPLMVPWAFTRSRYAKPILKELTRDPGGRGRDSNRRGAAAMVLRWLLEDKGIDFQRIYDDFTVDSPLVAGAFRYPRMTGDDGEPVSYTGLMEVIKGRGSTRSTQDGILGRANPEVIERQVVRSFVDFSNTPLRTGDPSSGLRWPKMRSAMGLDGFYVPINAEQRQSVSLADEVLLNGRFDLKEAAFGRKGDSKCRGFIALILTNLYGPICTAYIQLIPANEFEASFVVDILEGYRKWSGDAFYDLEYLVMDRLYLDDATCKTLILGYGINPIIPWREDRGGALADNTGTPYCELHGGKRTNMAYLGATGFRDPRERLARGLTPGESLEALLTPDPTGARPTIKTKELPHVEYACPVKRCKSRKTLWAHAKHNAVLCMWVPYLDVHKPKIGVARYRIRAELQPQRNCSEAMNAVLQRRGLGLPGEACPRGIKTFNEMRWYAAGRALGHNYKRLAQLNGALERAHLEAAELGFFKPKGRRWLRKQLRVIRARKTARREVVAEDIAAAA